MRNALRGICACAAVLYGLMTIWIFAKAGWEKFWYGQAVSLAETTARARAEFSSPQTGIPALLWVVVIYFAAGAGLYLLIAVFLWAQKQWEAEAPEEFPQTVEQWEEFLAVATAHAHDGRPICQKCGVPIPEGEAVLLTDDEKSALAQGRGINSLPGAFRHMKEADCHSESN
ncbi:MAG: hypothetical protein E6K61_09000 [Nitrospirae bacterium]|nr:MAG: hypothetical protein E6K61_09000 [Nitrospirota bacterium]